MKKFLALIMVFAVALIAFGFAVVYTETYNRNPYEEITLNSHEEIILIEELPHMDFLNNPRHPGAIARNIYSLFPMGRDGRRMYPDSFGGMYFGDNGKLVFLIVSPETSINSDAESLLKRIENIITDDVIIRHVDYSENELTAIMNCINEFFRANPDSDITKNIDMVALSTSDNRIKVMMREPNEKEILLFQQTVIDSPSVVFMESPGIWLSNPPTLN